MAEGLIRLALIERVSPELLIRLLRPYERHLMNLGAHLEGVERDSAWAHALRQVLISERGIPEELREALLDISDLATEEGHENILRLAEERHIELLPSSEPICVEDLAFRFYLEHPEAFRAAHLRMTAPQGSRLVHFVPSEVRQLSAEVAAAAKAELIDRLREHFAARNRGEFVDLAIVDSNNEIAFRISRSRPRRRLQIIHDKEKRKPLSLIPEQQDSVIFDKLSGHLCVDARWQEERDKYRRLWGEVFFGDNDFFQTKSILTGEPLLENVDEALSTEGIPELSAVELRAVELQAIDSPYDRLSWSARDLRPLIRTWLPALMSRERRVISVKLALFLRGSKKPYLVEFRPPNCLQYPWRDSSRRTLRQFLVARGFKSTAPRPTPSI